MSLICPQLVYIPGFSFAATLTEKMDWEELKVISNSALHNLTWIQCLLGLLGQISIRLISIRLLFFYSCLSGWDCSTFNSYKHACYHNEVSKPGSLPWWKHTSLKWQKLLSKTAVCTFLLWTHLARFPSTPSFSCSPLPQSNFPAAISYKDSFYLQLLPFLSITFGLLQLSFLLSRGLRGRNWALAHYCWA